MTELNERLSQLKLTVKQPYEQVLTRFPESFTLKLIKNK